MNLSRDRSKSLRKRKTPDLCYLLLKATWNSFYLLPFNKLAVTLISFHCVLYYSVKTYREVFSPKNNYTKETEGNF